MCSSPQPLSKRSFEPLGCRLLSLEANMKRREFLGVLSGAATFPLAVAAQPGRMPRVGLLMLGNPDPSLFLREVTAGLRELGYEDGRNMALERRNANGSAAQLNAHARELATLP